MEEKVIILLNNNNEIQVIVRNSIRTLILDQNFKQVEVPMKKGYEEILREHRKYKVVLDKDGKFKEFKEKDLIK